MTSILEITSVEKLQKEIIVSMKKFPDIERYTATLVDVNESMFTRKIIENLLRSDEKIKMFNPSHTPEQQFSACCGELMNGFDEVKNKTRNEIINMAEA